METKSRFIHTLACNDTKKAIKWLCDVFDFFLPVFNTNRKKAGSGSIRDTSARLSFCLN